MRRISLAALLEQAAAAGPGASMRLISGPSDPAITTVSEDSRQIGPDSLFVARPGFETDGRKFIAAAVERGAVAVLSDALAAVPQHVAHLTADNVPLAAAVLAECFCGFPSRSLHLVGVTGTNGKTTTAHLLRQLLNSGESRCGLIGTVEIDDGVSQQPAHLTTPSAIELSGLIRRMSTAGCKACVMECSSHALHQQRVAGLAFDVAIFTNLTGDHLDYHDTMEAYIAAKALLFESLPGDGIAIINADDPHWGRIVQRCAARVLRCSMDRPEVECFAEAGAMSMSGTKVRFRGPWGLLEAHLPLIGRHNIMNALQAVAAAHALGFGVDQLRRALAECAAPPGRLEPVAPADHPFAVFVDYAHTDDALDNVLRAVRPLVPKGGRLRVVFGCGGDRDRTKRPRMARAAAKTADEIIITSDNPRTEDPETIICEVAAGLSTEQQQAARCITDRREAIREAIFGAAPGDVVLIAGKGHEDYQIVGTKKRPFDDRLIAAEAIEELRHSNARVCNARGSAPALRKVTQP